MAKKEVPVTRETSKEGTVQVILQLPQDGIPMGVLTPISYGEDFEFQEKVDAYRQAHAEHECLEANVQALEQSLSTLKNELQMSRDRVIAKRHEVDEYLAKHLNKENRRDPQRTQ